MKLKYEKPMIAVENYELTQMIASCVTRIGMYNSDCVKNDPDSTPQMKNFALSNWFLSGYCGKHAEGMDGYDSICYHTNANAAFSS